MTRREEIELAWFSKEVQSNHRYDKKTFKEAVEWADKTMIDKVCEWLRRYNTGVRGEEFIKEFRKAMEE